MVDEIELVRQFRSDVPEPSPQARAQAWAAVMAVAAEEVTRRPWRCLAGGSAAPRRARQAVALAAAVAAVAAVLTVARRPAADPATSPARSLPLGSRAAQVADRSAPGAPTVPRGVATGQLHRGTGLETGKQASAAGLLGLPGYRRLLPAGANRPHYRRSFPQLLQRPLFLRRRWGQLVFAGVAARSRAHRPPFMPERPGLHRRRRPGQQERTGLYH